MLARAATVAVLLLLTASCRGNGTRQVECPPRETDCNGTCVDLQTDEKNCGACANACAASFECVAGACQPICGANEHVCNGVCVSSLSTATCGTRCEPCPEPDGGIATCNGVACGLICPPTLRPCGGECASCPTTSGGLTCEGNRCVASSCPAGQHLCNGECVDENGGSCGETCLRCPEPPANGFQVCLNGGCEHLCRPGNRLCAEGCCASDFVEVGAFHSCTVTPTGAVQCWGRNRLDGGFGGAVGDGSLLDRSTAQQVTGLTAGMVAVQPGDFHTCAMDQFGTVQCWGHAGLGRLGDGTTSDKLNPAAAMGLGQGVAVAFSAGGSGACALTRGGQVRCWGDNTHGEVGDGTTMPRSTPVGVPDLGTSATDVTFGGSHACALMRGGTVRCWGDNARGQLGDATQTGRLRPVLVMGLFDAVRVSAGERHTCAVRKNGEVLCWGDNASAQLGLPSSDTFRSAPVKVDGVALASTISAGGAHTCALLGTGQISCWGANASGQLGDGTTDGRPGPMPVTGISDGTSVSAGALHTCARTRSGTRCWGQNDYGQLGDGTNVTRLTPVMAR
ncbi:MAG: hypothetical protein JNK82_42840 [Myxococcaceae bacterium]|nr:hypothetical protein [Myxococcaceae bacterium]